MTGREVAARAACPRCGAIRGQRCISKGADRWPQPHAARRRRAEELHRGDVAAGRLKFLPRGRKPVDTGADRAEALLVMPRARAAAADEQPVDTRTVNWRATAPWETGLMVEARHRERRAERHLFDGVGS